MADLASRPRLLLLLPSTTYRATAFVEAARRLDLDLTVATDRPSVFAALEPERLVTFDFAHPERAAEQAREFAARHPLRAVVGVDDDTAVIAAAIAEELRLPHNPLAAARAARDKHRQRVLHAERGVRVPESALHEVSEPPAAVARDAPYPCVLKPLCLSASRGVIRADTPEQFVAAHAALARILAAPEVAALGTAARRYHAVIQRATAMAQEHHVKLHAHVLSGHPVRDIVELAVELKADLLVIGATGHSAFYERMIGSRADRLIQLAPCPVLVIK